MMDFIHTETLVVLQRQVAQQVTSGSRKRTQSDSWFFIVFANRVTLIDLQINWNLVHIVVQINNVER